MRWRRHPALLVMRAGQRRRTRGANASRQMQLLLILRVTLGWNHLRVLLLDPESGSLSYVENCGSIGGLLTPVRTVLATAYTTTESLAQKGNSAREKVRFRQRQRVTGMAISVHRKMRDRTWPPWVQPRLDQTWLRKQQGTSTGAVTSTHGLHLCHMTMGLTSSLGRSWPSGMGEMVGSILRGRSYTT